MMRDIAVPPDLAGHIQRLLLDDGGPAATYDVYPDVACVLGIQLTGRLEELIDGTPRPLRPTGITGLHQRPKAFRRSADCLTVLVRLDPLATGQILRVPAGELAGASLALDDLLGAGAVGDLDERIRGVDGQWLAVLTDWLRRRLVGQAPDPVLSAALSTIRAACGQVTVRNLSRDLNISERQLERRFTLAIGVSPKRFAAIVRFRAAVAAAGARSLADVAQVAGYYDQSHFIREFRTLTGHPPRDLLAGPTPRF